MEENESFYLTLPSNSKRSFELFAKNTVSRYTTQLHRSITLPGHWEVALVETVFPLSFYNIAPDSCQIHFYISQETDERKLIKGRDIIPAGYYGDIGRILAYLNKIPQLSDLARFEYDDTTSRVKINSKAGV